MTLLSILSKYKPEDALTLQQEQYRTNLSEEEQYLLRQIEDSSKPWDPMLNPQDTLISGMSSQSIKLDK